MRSLTSPDIFTATKTAPGFRDRFRQAIPTLQWFFLVLAWSALVFWAGHRATDADAHRMITVGLLWNLSVALGLTILKRFL